MNYVSTRDKNNKVSSAEAIAHGISKEGGLFVPESFPKLSNTDFENMFLNIFSPILPRRSLITA